MADYPAHLAREHCLADGRKVLIRPIRPEDESAERAFFDALSGETRRRRFIRLVRTPSDELLHFFTHIDYHRQMAFVCETRGAGASRLVGDARYVVNPDGRSAEFSVVIADDWHHTGIAQLLMEALFAAARAAGVRSIQGLVLRENEPMLGFSRALGFDVAPDPWDAGLVRITRALAA